MKTTEINTGRFDRIGELLIDLYGEDLGRKNISYLEKSIEAFSATRAGSGDVSVPGRYDRLAGRVFAICYPDNVCSDNEPTLKTLGNVLEEHFPAVKGIHILPERLMSHDDLQPQDLFELMSPKASINLVETLVSCGILDKGRKVADGLEKRTAELAEEILMPWFKTNAEAVTTDQDGFCVGVLELLKARYNAHFNDGGFSQMDRSRVDPRFGTGDDLRELTNRFAIMLDYVVNHVDIDNPLLEAFRRGEGDGSAFVVISPEKYESLKNEGLLGKTFRPRPFPLFTGVRKYPELPDTAAQLAAMNELFAGEELASLDDRLLGFFAIFFKVRNDQGLTSEDRRLFSLMLQYLDESGTDISDLYEDSDIQPQQKVLRNIGDLSGLCEKLNLDTKYAGIFEKNEDLVFGERFFVYTTFSESQADINPVSESGFHMIFDDLFHLLSSGDLAMMRMDAIKYLWKEIGGKNFDMDEGNKLIEVMRLVLEIAAPALLPLDEINSPDPVVYDMCKKGGFAYLFGQVNAVPAAFNGETLGPIVRFRNLVETGCPENLLLFVMLSTHDGRSVQGLGVDRTDGHVTIAEFVDFAEGVRSRGGRAKYRTVLAGEIPEDTFGKVCREAELNPQKVNVLFDIDNGVYRLKKAGLDRDEFTRALSDASGRRVDELAGIPAVAFMADWLLEGKTPYELCCTSRSAFSPATPGGRTLTPAEEAARLALAQVYVFTLGQVVPAIYFNDLLGLANDMEGFSVSGKPRDLNRHKNRLSEITESFTADEFTRVYVPLVNAVISARARDRAFYPGSSKFEFAPLSDTLFLNHAYEANQHSFVVGNILSTAQEVSLTLADFAETENLTGTSALRDLLTGDTVEIEGGKMKFVLPPYGAAWFSSQE